MPRAGSEPTGPIGRDTTHDLFNRRVIEPAVLAEHLTQEAGIATTEHARAFEL